MNWFLIAFAAQFILGSSAVFDKLLLKKSYPNPVGYTFWLGVLGMIGIVLIPFGFHAAPPAIIILALTTGIIFIAALLFYFLALSKGEASHIIILIGALTPIFTLLFSDLILHIQLAPLQLIGFAILILGGVILFFVEGKETRMTLFLFGSVSAIFFGLTDTLTKSVFLQTNFATGFVWIKIGGLLAVLGFLLLPRFREHILRPAHHNKFRNPIAYIANRGYAGVGSILLSYAILLGSPPLVDATQSIRYIFVLLGGWLLLKERFRGWALVGKIIAIVIISFGILWFSIGEYLNATAPNPDRPITRGVTFSQKFSQELGLNWKENYDAILDDLGVKHIRLVAYWDIIEPTNNEFSFDDLDYQIQAAAAHGAQVILAVGQKVPRWPECHYPSWTTSLSYADRQQKLLIYMERVVNHYKNSDALATWEVENEPFLPFGECPPLDQVFLDKEIALVKATDQKHPILISDSGEISSWVPAMKRGDVFGTTMYRRVHNNKFGQIDYHLPPEFFRVKEKIARFLTGKSNKKAVVIELAAEPWLRKQLWQTTPEEQFQYFDLPFFKDTIRYANATGFDEYYLWGAEWWYWLKTKQNHPEFWEYGRSVMAER